MVALGGAWLLWGGMFFSGGRGRGHGWFFLGGMHSFLRGGMCGFFWGGAWFLPRRVHRI